MRSSFRKAKAAAVLGLVAGLAASTAIAAPSVGMVCYARVSYYPSGSTSVQSIQWGPFGTPANNWYGSAQQCQSWLNNFIAGLNGSLAPSNGVKNYTGCLCAANAEPSPPADNTL